MSIQICTVSGTCRDVLGNGFAGVTVKANLIRPILHPTDSSLILDYEKTTTTASDGTWSLALIETATPAATMTLSFFFPTASNQSTDRRDYTIIVPNTATATFASLITGQNP